ncbi:3' terminal RNA ribose 2'-O-methyltransferase Hen1 [Risungbinella massiliensis]|uniref:3' terminal RNA ribose 2'-O-methyltransferase Hen1 n=1 Tax=Risungbinella massiliensis TaxID=1329796 RepID=UPI0005CBB75E|nr:3' terminal RNA ribose 2'-O-methyltransferase Hen1 [Risungbinella massiliensis]
MLFTLTYEGQDATDLGYLLHKNPSRVQEFELPFGKVHLFYPEATETRCTFAMLLDIDPISLSRVEEKGNRRSPLEPYVNDRPYVASSYFTTMLSKVLSTALNGTCNKRPELVEAALDLTAELSVLPSRGGEGLLRRLWEPLGYQLELTRLALDPTFPQWGDSPYYQLILRQKIRLSELLSHLYVLVPVLDNDKHYFTSEDELEKLQRHGGEWLANHPEKEIIVGRYLRHQKKLAKQVLKDLSPVEGQLENSESMLDSEKTVRLHELRHQIVVDKLVELGVRSVLDLGCGSGQLLQKLRQVRTFERIAGTDVSLSVLQKTQNKLERWEDPRIQLFQSSLLYGDKRHQGYEATVLVEVLEHIELDRLPMVEHQLFREIRSPYILLTTPNREYNQLYEGLKDGGFRHPDHRFEWTRNDFQSWGERIAKEYGYQVRFFPLGEEDETLGAPSQMALFHIVEKEILR